MSLTVTNINLTKAAERRHGKPYRVLVVSAAFPPVRSGESEHALYLCRQLSARGIDVHVLTGTQNVASVDEPFTLQPVMSDWGSRDILRLVNALHRVQPDAVLLIYSAWMYNSHPLVTILPTIVRRLLRKPLVTQFEYVEEKKPQTRLSARVFSLLARWWAGRGADWYYGTLLRDSRRIIVLNDQYRDVLAQTQPGIESKSLLIPPPSLLHLVPEPESGMARQQKRKEWKAQESDFVVAFFGYVYPGKGVDVLLRAAALVPNVRVVLVGGELEAYADYAREMRNLAHDLGIAERVVWTGQYASDSEEPSRCLWAVDACVLPFDDGIAVNRSSFAAAAAHSLPVITTRGADVDPMFVDEENVMLCPTQDSDALAACLIRMASSPDLCLRLRVGIRRLMLAWFSWEMAVDRTLEALGVQAMRQTS